MRIQTTLCAAMAAGFIGAPTMAGLVWHVPGGQAYRSEAESPWSASADAWDFFALDNFESAPVAGFTMAGGVVRAAGPFTDSVDADDGVLDMFGTAGRSYLSDASMITAMFHEEVVGSLPTHAGLVWTDGNPLAEVTFLAYDAEGDMLDSISMTLGDGVGIGTAGEDRFIGVEYEGGISAIAVSVDLGRIEVDHVQFGVIPAPSAAAVLLGVFAFRRRRRLG